MKTETKIKFVSIVLLIAGIIIGLQVLTFGAGILLIGKAGKILVLEEGVSIALPIILIFASIATLDIAGSILLRGRKKIGRIFALIACILGALPGQSLFAALPFALLLALITDIPQIQFAFVFIFMLLFGASFVLLLLEDVRKAFK